jgi:hypothetical protein
VHLPDASIEVHNGFASAVECCNSELLSDIASAEHDFSKIKALVYAVLSHCKCAQNNSVRQQSRQQCSILLSFQHSVQTMQ